MVVNYTTPNYAGKEHSCSIPYIDNEIIQLTDINLIRSSIEL